MTAAQNPCRSGPQAASILSPLTPRADEQLALEPAPLRLARCGGAVKLAGCSRRAGGVDAVSKPGSSEEPLLSGHIAAGSWLACMDLAGMPHVSRAMSLRGWQTRASRQPPTRVGLRSKAQAAAEEDVGRRAAASAAGCAGRQAALRGRRRCTGRRGGCRGRAAVPVLRACPPARSPPVCIRCKAYRRLLRRLLLVLLLALRLLVLLPGGLLALCRQAEGVGRRCHNVGRDGSQRRPGPCSQGGGLTAMVDIEGEPQQRYAGAAEHREAGGTTAWRRRRWPRHTHLCAGPGRACRRCGWCAVPPTVPTASVCPSPGSLGCCHAAAAAGGRPSLLAVPAVCRRTAGAARSSLRAGRLSEGACAALGAGICELAARGGHTLWGSRPTVHRRRLRAAAVPAADQRTQIASRML